MMSGQGPTTRSRRLQHIAHDEEEPGINTPASEPPRMTVEDEPQDIEEESPSIERRRSIRDQLHETSPKLRFSELAHRYSVLEHENQDNVHQVEDLRSQNIRLLQQIEDLIIERDEAIAHTEHARREQTKTNLLMKTFASHQQKTTKMPDAPMFKDGKEVRFEPWSIAIRHKLQANADHFPDPIHRMIYVQSRCEGQAQLHLATRMDPDSSNAYQDFEDILTHLKTVFANPNRRKEAFNKFHKLRMNPKDKFTEFLSEFLQLAEEGNILKTDLKEHLWSMLPYLMQCQVM